MPSTLDDLQVAATKGGAAASLDALAARYRSENKYHELFEVLKLKLRLNLGLPLFPGDQASDDLPEDVRDKLEDGLLAACREVGESLLKQGKIREGWMYLRPVGDRSIAAKLIAGVQCDEDNYQDLIEVLLHEGVDPARGFGLLLQQNGVCNAVTTFDQMMHQRSKVERQGAATLLLDRLYDDLTANLKHDIQKQQGQPPKETSIKGLIADREWLLNDGAYHIDTTHLGAVVRFARVLDDKEKLAKALDLTEYGRRLSQPLQYAGDEPFADNFPAHNLFFNALLGNDVDAAVKYFGDKARMIDPNYHGSNCIETYIELLSRVGRHKEALNEALALMPEKTPSAAYAPLLIDLCQKTGDFAPMIEFCRKRDDALGFVAALAGGAVGNK